MAYITALTVINGGHWSIQPPSGYIKIPIDLNKGSGGDYIYLCYKRGYNNPVTSISVIEGRNAHAPYGFTRNPVDLNKGAGGAYLYVIYTRNTGFTPITDVTVIEGGSAYIQPPYGFTKIGVDCNKGAGGRYIYICYKK